MKQKKILLKGKSEAKRAQTYSSALGGYLILPLNSSLSLIPDFVCECCCCKDGDATWNHTNMHRQTGSSLGVWLSHFCSLLSGVLTVPHLSPFPSLSIHTNTHTHTVYTKSLPSKRHPHVCLNTRACVHISSPPSPHWTAFTNNICSLSADAPWGKTNFSVFTW